MTRKEAKQWLATSVKRCDHATDAEVVYRKRLYPLCKACFLMTITAMSTFAKETATWSAVAAYAYTIDADRKAYRPEIFHVWDQTILWIGPGLATKQHACEAAGLYLSAHQSIMQAAAASLTQTNEARQAWRHGLATSGRAPASA